MTFNGLHGIIYQEIELFIIAAVRNWNIHHTNNSYTQIPHVIRETGYCNLWNDANREYFTIVWY
jgi:hypothetical protein